VDFFYKGACVGINTRLLCFVMNVQHIKLGIIGVQKRDMKMPKYMDFVLDALEA
jgi:hypothetical protein